VAIKKQNQNSSSKMLIIIIMAVVTAVSFFYSQTTKKSTNNKYIIKTAGENGYKASFINLTGRDAKDKKIKLSDSYWAGDEF
jgi:hypothetical protein